MNLAESTRFSRITCQEWIKSRSSLGEGGQAWPDESTGRWGDWMCVCGAASVAFTASRSGEPDGVSLRTLPPNDSVRGLTPPGSPVFVEGRADQIGLGHRVNQLNRDESAVSSGQARLLRGQILSPSDQQIRVPCVRKETPRSAFILRSGESETF